MDITTGQEHSNRESESINNHVDFCCESTP